MLEVKSSEPLDIIEESPSPVCHKQSFLESPSELGPDPVLVLGDIEEPPLFDYNGLTRSGRTFWNCHYFCSYHIGISISLLK